MQDNIYAAPESNLNTTSNSPSVQEFYAVSRLKFFLLFYCTAGFYGVYWNYKNWRQYQIANNEEMWPIARAIFAIFFTHALYGIVYMRATEKDSSYKWSPNLWATLVVLFLIMETAVSRLGGDGTLSNVFIVVSLIARGIFMSQAQKAINVACGDPGGKSNNRFTLLNFLWIFMFPIIFIVAIMVAIVVGT